MVSEVIVVEGKDDVAKVKAAVDCECIITHGSGFGQDLLDLLEVVQERRGIIVLTDPDYAGKKIRSRIRERIPNAKMAYIPREMALRGDDIGVENAPPEAIRQALIQAHAGLTQRRREFTMEDLVRHGLEGRAGAKDRRILLGQALGIGYGNGKQILARLNEYDIQREEFESCMEDIHDQRGETLPTEDH